MTHQTDGAHHLRTRPRFKLFQPTEMTTATGKARVHLLNLSGGGALVHAAQPPKRGALLRLHCVGEDRAACVAWVAGQRFGVAFAKPLDDAQVSAMVGQPCSTTSVSTPRAATAQR